MKKTLVFCAGGPNPYLPILKEKKVDLLIGVDGGAQVLIEAGYLLDWAIGDFDSVPVPDSTCVKEIKVLPSEKDDTDLQYALHMILEKYTPEEIGEVLILGALGGGRLDHLICNLWLAYQSRFDSWLPKFSFIEKNQTVRFFRPGTYLLEKEPKKTYLSFISMTPIKGLTYIGAKYPLNKADFDRPVSLISNEFLDNQMQFSFEEGLLCVMQTSDEQSE